MADGRLFGQKENPAAQTCAKFADPSSVGICPYTRADPYRLFAGIRAVLGLVYRGTGAIALCIYPDIPSGTSRDCLSHRDPAVLMRLDLL